MSVHKKFQPNVLFYYIDKYIYILFTETPPLFYNRTVSKNSKENIYYQIILENEYNIFINLKQRFRRLMRKSQCFQGYRCKSGIAIFAMRVS